jgi:AAA+ ATPase superfamily predicted ATPase
MFVSREKELEALRKLYRKDKFQMVVMCGRRRVGKTTLITESIKGKPAIFFAAQEANTKLNLQKMQKRLAARETDNGRPE